MSRRAFRRPATELAPWLLGKLLVHESVEGPAAGMIVEAEAYTHPDDPANHAHRGRTERNAAMFGPPGIAYVYFVYGNHHCLNVVCAEEGIPEAVLIRALEPVAGLELMQRRRGTDDPRQLCSGPGKLCQALGITREFNGADLTSPPLYLADGEYETGAIVRTTRVGVIAAKDLPLRYCLRDSTYVSRR